MPVNKSQSSGSVLSKVKAAINPLAKKHAQDEIDLGFQTLPGGIRSGVARLSEGYFEVFKQGDNQGQPFLRLAGVVVEPEFHEGERVAGMQTSVMVPICPTGTGDKAKTLEDQVAAVQNELKKLGADPTSIEDTDSWEATVKQLVEEGPYFYFSTRESPEVLHDTGPNKGQVKYKARVWESWRGVKGLEDYKPEAGGTGSGMDQQPGKQADAKPQQAPPPRPAATQSAKQPPKSPPPVATTAGEYRDDADLDSLAQRADTGSGDDQDQAIASLTEQAEKAGVTEEQIAAVNSWAEVVALIKGGKGDDGSGGEDDWTPAVDEIYKYVPRDAQGNPLKDAKKKVVKAEEVVITAVDEEARTVDLKFNKTKKAVKGVSWDDVVRDE